MVTPQAKRLAASSLIGMKDMSQRRACQLIGLNRSTYYYQSTMTERDTALRARMKQLATQQSGPLALRTGNPPTLCSGLSGMRPLCVNSLPNW